MRTKIIRVPKEAVPEGFERENLDDVVRLTQSKAPAFLALAAKYPTPFYAFDELLTTSDAKRLLEAFRSYFLNFKGYYSLKINHHPLVIAAVLKSGFGLEVASQRELALALELGCTDILYYAPGKSDEDLDTILDNADHVRIHLDGPDELLRLDQIARHKQVRIRASIRVHLGLHGLWSKYGIPLEALGDVWRLGGKAENVVLDGLHFHTSRNKSTQIYEETIEHIGRYLKTSFSEDELARIKFFDFGGGFEVEESEGVIVRDTLFGRKELLKSETGNYAVQFDPYYLRLSPPPIEEYAEAISRSVEKHLAPLIGPTYAAEPGRYLCNRSMHIVLSVADLKSPSDCILNGGVNMVGWQRYEHEYFPLIDVSNPGPEDKPRRMWGNLCTPWDLWGYACHTSGLENGAVIVVPNQGALTYSLAQTFINPIPNVYTM